MTLRDHADRFASLLRYQGWLRLALTLLACDLGHVGTARATIYTCEWQPIPGTEHVSSGVDAKLDHLDLPNTCWRGHSLDRATFEGSNLTSALFADARLFDVNFRNANLTKARLDSSFVRGADFAGAILTGTDMTRMYGLTESMLTSSANYQARNLDGFLLGSNDMRGWNFSGQSMVGITLGSQFPFTVLTDANLRGADMTRGNLSRAYAERADFTGATFARANIWGLHIDGAIFDDTTSRGLLFTHMSSTATYSSGSLTGVSLRWNDLTNWSFAGKYLNDVNFSHSTLKNLNLADATISGVAFQDTTARGFTESILRSTASYRSRKMEGINLLANDLRGWNFSGQDLTDATFASPGIESAKLDQANLGGADLRGATLDGISGFSHANMIWPDGKMQGIELTAGTTLTIRDDDGVSKPSPNGRPVPRAPIPIVVHDRAVINAGGTLQLEFETDPWDSLIAFSPGIPIQLQGNLDLTFTPGTNVFPMWGRKLRIFDWTGTTPEGRLTLTGPYRWDESKLYTTGEVTLLGLSLHGDVNYDNFLTVRDIDLLATAIRTADTNPLYDMNRDGQVTTEDHRSWVEDIRKTWFGDANLDGQFNSGDLVVAFQAGLYEDAIAGNATWARGDWNGDGEFNSGDLVTAFQGGGYQMGPRFAQQAATVTVPEPSAGLLGGIACLLGWSLWRRARTVSA